MHRSDQREFLRREPQQGYAAQRTPGQVEGTLCHGGAQTPGLGLSPDRLQSCQVDDRHLQAGVLGDHLHGLAPERREGSPQRFVPAQQFGKAAGERRHIEPALQTEADCQVIGRAGRLELLQDPQTLLAKGQGQLPFP
jgi:hypothetical protein